MKQPLLSLSNDGKIIEKIHDWLSPIFEIVISASNQNLESSLDLIKKINPQILILDISPQTSFSYQTLEKLDGHYFELIVISENREDVLEGISFGLSSFLLKPLTETKLKGAIEKAFLKLEEKKDIQSLKEKYGKIGNEEQATKIISLPLLKGRSIKLRIEDIIRFESSGTMTQVYLKNSSKEFTMINGSIKKCEGLVGNQNFFRTHREHLVNLNYVKHFSGVGVSQKSITLVTGISLPIARRRYSEFLSQFDKFKKRVKA